VSVYADEYPPAKEKVTAGVTASVIVGVVIGAAFVATAALIPCVGPPSPAMEAWKPRARSAFVPIAVGVFLQSLGLVTGFAAPLIPWFSMGASGAFSAYTGGTTSFSAGLIFTAVDFTYETSFGSVTITSPLVIGAVIAFVGLIAFVFSSLIMGYVALCRVRAVSKYGAAPPVSCCGPGMPAIQGLAWFGMIMYIIGMAIDWTLIGLIRAVVRVGGVGPGGNLAAASFVFLLAGACSYSVAGCCRLGPLPGVGTSRSSCCCIERDPNTTPDGSQVKPALAVQYVQAAPAPAAVSVQVNVQAAPAGAVVLARGRSMAASSYL